MFVPNKKSTFLLILILLFFSIACMIFSSGSPSQDSLPHYGVFFENGGDYIEIDRHEGMPHFSDSGFIATENNKPTIIVWNSEINLEYLSLNMLDPKYTEIDYNVKPLGEDLYEIKPSDELELSSYCLIQGDPLLSPASLSTWCFEVADGTSDVNESNSATNDVIELYFEIQANDLSGKEVNNTLVTFDPSGENLYVWVEYLDTYNRPADNESLFIVNLLNKSINEIVSFEDPLRDSKEETMSISPDGKYIQISQSLESRIGKIIDTNSGEVTTYRLEQVTSKNPVIYSTGWMPNANNLYAVYYKDVIAIHDPFTGDAKSTKKFGDPETINTSLESINLSLYWSYDKSRSALSRRSNGNQVISILDNNFSLINEFNFPEIGAGRGILGWIGKDELILQSSGDSSSEDTFYIIDSNNGDIISQFQLDANETYPGPNEGIIITRHLDEFTVVENSGAVLQQHNQDVRYHFGEWNAKGDMIVMTSIHGDIHIWKVK